jgi:hypothetical protein
MKIIYDSNLPEELRRRLRKAEKPVMPLKKAYKVLRKHGCRCRISQSDVSDYAAKAGLGK